MKSLVAKGFSETRMFFCACLSYIFWYKRMTLKVILNFLLKTKKM